MVEMVEMELKEKRDEMRVVVQVVRAEVALVVPEEMAEMVGKVEM